MSFKKNLSVWGATCVAMIAMSSVSAAEFVDLTTTEVSAVKNLLKNTSLKEIKRGKDLRGNVHIRYAQTYQGIPVYGQHIIKHQRVNGVASAPLYTGGFVKGLHEDVGVSTKPAFSDQDALVKAKQLFLDEHQALQSKALQYGIQESKLVYYIENEKAQLAYAINFFVDSEAGGEPARPYYIMDAKTGSVLAQWDGLTTAQVGTGPGGNGKTGQYNYDGKKLPKLDVDVEPLKNSCTMTTKVVRTVNLNKLTSGTTPYSYTCFKSDSDAINGGFSPLNDAHFFGGLIYAMYENWYQIAPINSVLIMRTHYSKNYENAFWDGQFMSFGDGADTFYPLVILDVASHEVSHGFTEQNSGLEYRNQSGGLNESFSDMAGKSVEYYAQGHNIWSVGEPVMKKPGALRYMDLPSRDGRSIDNASQYYDGIDPHFSSGVFNRAFFLIATSPGYTTHKAFDLMVNANAHYWVPQSTYQDAAQGVLMTAHDLGYDAAAVVTAFAKVGVNIS
jgi:Zn-dependent metalloprotease